METDKIIHEKYNFIEKCINNIEINPDSVKYSDHIKRRQSIQNTLNASRNQYMLATLASSIDSTIFNDINAVIDSLSILSSINKLV